MFNLLPDEIKIFKAATAIKTIAEQISDADLFEMAGQLYQQIGFDNNAAACYRRKRELRGEKETEQAGKVLEYVFRLPAAEYAETITPAPEWKET